MILISNNFASLSIIGYFEGIAANLELMPTYYPGWIMRVYYDLEDDDPITQVIDLFRKV